MKTFLTLLFLYSSAVSFAQADTTIHEKISVFKKMESVAINYQLDTTAPPDDFMTRKIKRLRQLRGGFNIQEFIEFKIGEERQKGNINQEESIRHAQFFEHGEGKRLLDNAVTWIYRRHFTYRELKQMVRFYRTSAGQKWATDFPVVLIETVRAAESIKGLIKD